MSPAREADFMAQPEDIIDRRDYDHTRECDHIMKDCREALGRITGDHPDISAVGEAGISEAAGGTDDL